jgi:hypothetical protein
MSMSPKAESVSQDGELDGFTPEPCWSAEVIPGGYTRLEVSLPNGSIEAVHRALVARLGGPLRVLYVQLTDRIAGSQLDPPRRFVALDVMPNAMDGVLAEFSALVYHDGRHQLWIQGKGEDKIILEETGVMYAYPDDPAFRDVLANLGVAEGKSETMADRDYVRVNFRSECDAMEGRFRQAIGAVSYA